MKKLLRVGTVLVVAFLVREYVTGMTKQCVYQFGGNEYTRTIQSYQLCPLTINVSL